jgi:alpha-N-acetylglucosamine transferase
MLEPQPTVRPLEPAFKVAWIKLHLFMLVSYDKILYLDSDVVPAAGTKRRP